MRITHPLISRAHLLLRFDQGKWLAIDNGSLNTGNAKLSTRTNNFYRLHVRPTGREECQWWKHELIYS